MAENNFFTRLSEKLTGANAVLLVLPSNNDFDETAAALAVFLSLKNLGKQVEVVSPQSPIVNLSRLVGVDQIKTELEGKNLIVSLDYVKEAIAKVSYQIDENNPRGKKFNLIVQPEEGSRPLSSKDVRFTYGGAQFDLVLTFGVNKLIDLGDLYQKNQSLFDAKEKVFHFYREKQAGLSQRTVELISQLKFPFGEDVATNLALGIEEASRNFSPELSNTQTFELFAYCLRAGARRGSSTVQSKEEKLIERPSLSQEAPPVDQVEKKEGDQKEAPQEWLQPKIYKSNTRL